MSTRKGENGAVNKSAAIREILVKNPHTPTKEVITTLSDQGMKVLPSLVYFIKGKAKRKQRREIGKSMAQAGMSNPVDLIMKVRNLAGEAGGMGKLKQLVDALAD